MVRYELWGFLVSRPNRESMILEQTASGWSISRKSQKNSLGKVIGCLVQEKVFSTIDGRLLVAGSALIIKGESLPYDIFILAMEPKEQKIRRVESRIRRIG